MDYELKKVRELRGLGLVSGETAQVRERVIQCLTALGVDVSAAPAPVIDGPGRTVVIWASDADFAIQVFSIPDDAVTSVQRAALAATPFCFADVGDCSEAGWFGALRVLAAMGHGQNGAELFELGVQENELEGMDGAPTREELVDGWKCWDAYCAATLTDREDLSWLAARFTSIYAFNRAM